MRTVDELKTILDGKKADPKIAPVEEGISFPLKNDVDAVEELKLRFPWSAGMNGEKDLDRIDQFLSWYFENVKKIARTDKRLQEHVGIMGKVMSAMGNMRVRLKDAETALYRIKE